MKTIPASWTKAGSTAPRRFLGQPHTSGVRWKRSRRASAPDSPHLTLSRWRGNSSDPSALQIAVRQIQPSPSSSGTASDSPLPREGRVRENAPVHLARDHSSFETTLKSAIVASLCQHSSKIPALRISLICVHLRPSVVNMIPISPAFTIASFRSILPPMGPGRKS